MLEEPPILTMRRSWRRPSAEQLAKFKGVQTGQVVDGIEDLLRSSRVRYVD